MCEIISNQLETDFARNTRTVRISGHVTSVQLESYYWRILETVAEREHLTLPQLLNKLNQEFIELRNSPPSNFASMLRVGCLKFVGHYPDII